MPVNLRGLPDELNPPPAPNRVRWLLIILLCSLAGSAMTLLFWPGEMQPKSLWFWCCVLVFPVAGACLLYGLRQFVYEYRLDYVENWNSARVDLALYLIGKGQERIGLLASAYCTPAGSARLAEALRKGSRPLQAVYQASTRTLMNISPLVAQQPQEQTQRYPERLEAYLDRVLAVLMPDLHRIIPGQAARVRIRHNQILADDQVLQVWGVCAQRRALAVESVSVTNHDDGLMWLDTWLDAPQEYPVVLSVELNLFDQVTADQAESISALLFAHEGHCSARQITPMAWVHRPVAMSCDPQSANEVLLWGHVSKEVELFAWQAHVEKEHLRELNGALLDQRGSLAPTDCLRLDDCLGAPGCAVGNISLIVGGEQSVTNQQPQLLMMLDATPHWCVVRPAQ